MYEFVACPSIYLLVVVYEECVGVVLTGSLAPSLVQRAPSQGMVRGLSSGPPPLESYFCSPFPLFLQFYLFLNFLSELISQSART